MRPTKNDIHGMSGTKIYSIWVGMRSRCENKNHNKYGYYGGRGIGVCSAWSVFSSFYSDMGDKPEGVTLERIDNSLGYSPSNCTWASHSVQSRNKRNNAKIEVDGECHLLCDFLEGGAISTHSVYMRVNKYNFSLNEAISTPIRSNQRIEKYNSVIWITKP